MSAGVEAWLVAKIGKDWDLLLTAGGLVIGVGCLFAWYKSAGEQPRGADYSRHPGVLPAKDALPNQEVRKLQQDVRDLAARMEAGDDKIHRLERRLAAVEGGAGGSHGLVRPPAVGASLPPRGGPAPVAPSQPTSAFGGAQSPRFPPATNAFGMAGTPPDPPYDRPPERPPQPVAPRRDPMQDARAATLQAWRDVWKPGLDLQRFAGLLRTVPGFSGVQEKERMAWVELGAEGRFEVVILPIYFEAFINERYYEVPGGSRDAFIEAVQRPAVLAHGQSEPTRGLAVTNIAGA